MAQLLAERCSKAGWDKLAEISEGLSIRMINFQEEENNFLI